MNEPVATDRQPAAARPAGAAAFDLRDLLRLLSARRWLVAATMALVLLATGVLTFLATPYHRAKVRVLIERHNATPNAFQEIYQLGTAADDYYSTQYKILESRAVAAAALASLSDADRATFGGPGRDPVDEFLRLRQILPVTKSRLVDVVADHPDPAIAGRAAAALVAAYVKNGLARLENASSEALNKLARDAEGLQQKLLVAETSVQEFRRRNEMVTTGDRDNLVAARLEKLTEELAEIERTRSDAGARLQTAEAVVADADWATALPEVLDNPVVANCKRALLEANAERSQLAQNYKDRHPRMLAVASKIAAMEAQLRIEIEAVHHGLQRQLERAQNREADVRRRLEEQKKALLDLESRRSQYDLLVEEAEATRKLHDTVLARLKEVQLIHGAEQTNVHTIGEVEVSGRPVRPDKLLNFLFALLGGCVLACGLAFTADLCDRTLKTEDEVQRTLGLVTLGSVPRLAGRRPAGGRLDAETLDERSALSEAFRTIRTNLAFGSRSRSARVFAITSTAPSEGKSMVAINLAVAFARSGRRVLLVDADMRRPRLHKAFALAAGEGLSSLLIGSRELGSLVHATPVDNLWLLPCGVIPPNPVELLGSAGLQPAQAAMLAAYDVLVYDSPPIGVVSDACVLGAVVDQVLFVASSCRTNRSHARRSVAQLRATGAALAGTVVNNVDVRSSRYGETSVGYTYGGDEPGTRRANAAEPESEPESEEVGA